VRVDLFVILEILSRATSASKCRQCRGVDRDL
jgi:hypothetical protein